MRCLLPGDDQALDADLSLLADTAREAGALALDFMQRGARAWEKGPGDPVTEADIAVNDLIAERLRTARPDYGWLSEETKDDPADRAVSRTFVVDPIDGTKDFVLKRPGYCVSIARLEDGIPVVGAICNPMTDELLLARKGGGASRNGQAMQVEDREFLNESKIVGSNQLFSGLHEDFWPPLELISPMPNAVAYRMSLVAIGPWHATAVLSDKKDWDMAAADLIVREAGGMVTDRGGNALRYNKASPVQRGVVAAGANLHALLMKNINELRARYEDRQ